jgi:YD repeat-containing protein
MRQCKGLLSWGLCAVLVGCGTTREELPPGQDTPAPSAPGTNNPPTGEVPSDTPETPSQEPTVPQVEPLPSPGEVPPVSAGLEGEPTLAPVACVPWTGSVPPQRATACEGTSVFQDGRREVARYDAESRLLELRTYRPDGSPDSLERHTWVNGRETFRRIESLRPNGSWTQIEWVYDAAGRLQKRTDTFSSQEAVVYEHVRDSNGRLERIDRLPTSARNTPIVYRYNAAGQLVAIDSEPNCDRYVARCETFTYWPNGKLREDTWDDDGYAGVTNQYDDRGHLVDESEYAIELNRHTVNSHDKAGRRFRIWEKVGRYVYDHEFINTFYSDASGLLLLERLGKDYTQPSGDSPDSPRVTTRVRTTRRLTYLCGTKIVALDEWDGNEDGVVDARRTHERDAKGRLAHEEYSGTPGLDEGPVRRDFKYECD